MIVHPSLIFPWEGNFFDAKWRLLVHQWCKMTHFASLANPISERNAELSLLREKWGRDERSFKHTTGFLFIQRLMQMKMNEKMNANEVTNEKSPKTRSLTGRTWRRCSCRGRGRLPFQTQWWPPSALPWPARTRQSGWTYTHTPSQHLPPGAGLW